MAEKILQVRHLSVNFKTDNGLVQAVRDVSFDLERGETLCIVGESGSGKSVSSKAIMGILANNAIIESGSIIYEGENLLEISEEEFHRIRGNKIGLIFQDPLSSLNPIVKIGKQITEATLLNGNLFKKKYNELISKELTAYKNNISKCKILTKNAKDAWQTLVNKYKEPLKDKNVAEAEKQKMKAEIEAAKANYLKVAEETKAEMNSKKPALAEALKARKIEAKKEVRELKVQYKKEYEEKLAEAKAKNDVEAIKQIKVDYINKTKITRKEAKRQAIEIMREVGIPMPEQRFYQYPFEFSGGMRQRIVIAIALAATPEILICDEPTTALDVTIQAQILELIKKIQKERNIACIFITHDLGVVANMADRVAVMYAGKIVEYGTAKEIFFEPKHPYTWALLSSIPDVDSKERLDAIPGTPPNMIYPPKGDAFALRSKYAMKIDFERQPPYFKVSDTHYAATWLLHEDAPKVKMPKIVVSRIYNALKDEDSADAKRIIKELKETQGGLCNE